MIDVDALQTAFYAYVKQYPAKDHTPTALCAQVIRVLGAELARQQKEIDALKWKLDFDPAKEPR